MSALDTLGGLLSSSVNNPERPHDFPGGFQIVEYVDGVANTETEIKLIGNLMPHQPFTWSGEQRLVKEYYPGNPEPSVQVLGAKEGALTIKGRFKDKRYKDTSWYGVSYQYNLAINEMRKRGNLVKFGMNSAPSQVSLDTSNIKAKAGSWIRWGFIERCEFKMNKLSWIDYEIEFFVVSENQPKNNYFAAPEKSSASAVNQNLINQAAAFQANYSSVPTSMPLSIAGLMNNITGGVASAVKLVTNFVDSIASTAQSVEDSANRALGLIKYARNKIHQYGAQYDHFSHAFGSISTQGSLAGKARDAYKNISYSHESMAAVTSMSVLLARMQAQFEALAVTVPKARYKVQVGDTLQNISIKFYQTSTYWSNIYDHNKLTSTQLIPGTILEIPKV